MKWFILKLGQRKYKMNVEYLVILDSKKELKNQSMGTCQRDIEFNRQDLPSSGHSWNYLNNKISKIVLDYNPQSKINMCESKLIKMIELENK